jgi:hypothetical protein
MKNSDINKLKKYIKFKNVIDIVPVDIPNWAEKLSGKDVRGKKRTFSASELGYIHSALLAVASDIIKVK